MASVDGIAIAPFAPTTSLNLAVYLGAPANLGQADYDDGYDDGYDAGHDAGYDDGVVDGYDAGFLAAQDIAYAYPGEVIVVTAQDYAGNPITGLTPSWTVHVNSLTGAAQAGPSITAVGGGHYKFSPSGTAPCGIIDLGSGATPRYWVYNPINRVFVIVAYDDQGQPLAGLTPTWVNLKFVSDGTDATQPDIEELSGGLYKTTMFEDHVVGLIDLGEDAFPRYVQYDSESYLAPGYALGFSDGQNDPAQVVSATTGVDKIVSARMMNPTTGLPQQLDTTDGIEVQWKKYGGSFNVITPILAINGEYLDITLDGATDLDTVGLSDLEISIPARLPVAIKVDVEEPPTGDLTPPTIVIVSPAPGSTIGASTPLKFRYLDETGLRRPMPAIKFEKRDSLGTLLSYHYEIIHDGEDFTPDYTGMRAIIAGGFEYTVQRVGGWAATIAHEGGSPILVPFGTDVGGNEPA